MMDFGAILAISNLDDFPGNRVLNNQLRIGNFRLSGVLSVKSV
jgi:hypothetical protein